MNEPAAWAGALFAAVASGLVVIALLRARARLPQDVPNPRSLKSAPLPRGGGLAIWAGWIPVALWFSPVAGAGAAQWLLPWLALAGVSLRDDVRALGVGVRLAVHAAAALGFAVTLAWPDAAAGSWPAAALATVACAGVVAWSLNLYNFMDGNDGLAAAMAIAGFACYGAGAGLVGMPGAALFALAAATLPFLAVNLPPSRMLMGDVGAVPLGFLAGAFGCSMVAGGRWPAWFPALVFLPFLADATVTLLRRALRGERVWEAHRGHYYQRLHRLGAGHAGTLAIYAAWMAGCGVTALACLAWNPGLGWAALGAWALTGAAMFAAIDYHWKARPDSLR